MPKIIRGTRDAKNNTVLRGGEGGLRKLRCTSCQGTATQQVQANGKSAYVCQCGAVYTVSPL